MLLLALSTVTPSFGPPGAYKLLIGVALGVAAEVGLMILGRKPWAYVATVAVVFGLSVPITYGAWLLFELPAVAELRPHLPLCTGIYVILGGIGASLGAFIYRSRLEKYRIVKQIRQGN